MTDVEVPFVAQNIVNQLADLWEVPVPLRQATNDQADQFVAKLLADMLTAAEVKVLTETATRLGREIGRMEAWAEAVEAIEEASANIYGDRHALHEAVDVIRSLASQPAQAPSDAISGVDRHQEVSETARSPQEPQCGECGDHDPCGVRGCPFPSGDLTKGNTP